MINNLDWYDIADVRLRRRPERHGVAHRHGDAFCLPTLDAGRFHRAGRPQRVEPAPACPLLPMPSPDAYQAHTTNAMFA